MPILDSSNKISNKSGLGGVHWNTSDYNQRYNQYNRDPNSSSHGGIGGFGGGAASYYEGGGGGGYWGCLLYTSPSPRDGLLSRMPSSA